MTVKPWDKSVNWHVFHLLLPINKKIYSLIKIQGEHEADKEHMPNYKWWGIIKNKTNSRRIVYKSTGQGQIHPLEPVQSSIKWDHMSPNSISFI